MIIREINKEHRDKVFEMMQVFYSSDAVGFRVSDEVLLLNIDNCIQKHPHIDGFVFVDEEVIGYCMVAKSYSTEYGGMCYFIEDIFLCAEARGKGAVSKLFVFLEDHYKNSAVRFRLEVCESNAHAINSYIKNGYHKLDYLQMAKEVQVSKL